MKHHTIQKNHKTLIIAVFVVGVLLYAGLNIWVFNYAQKLHSKGTSKSAVSINDGVRTTGNRSTNPIQELIQNINKSTGLSTKIQPNPTPIYINTDKSLAPGYVPPAKVVPTPTPTPIPGPGKYACDPDGICGVYSDSMRSQYCPASFADQSCLGQCSDTAKRCRR